MDDKEMRSRNRRVGAAVLVGMLAMAGLAAAYALYTVDYRRQVDAVQPDARPLKRDLVMVTGLTVAATCIGLLFYRWRAGKAE